MYEWFPLEASDCEQPVRTLGEFPDEFDDLDGMKPVKKKAKSTTGNCSAAESVVREEVNEESESVMHEADLSNLAGMRHTFFETGTTFSNAQSTREVREVGSATESDVRSRTNPDVGRNTSGTTWQGNHGAVKKRSWLSIWTEKCERGHPGLYVILTDDKLENALAYSVHSVLS